MAALGASSRDSPKVLYKDRDDEDTNEINRGIQKLKMDKPHAVLITINFGTSSDPETKVNVTERRPTTESVIRSEHADIYFVQEITASGSPTWKLDIERYECIKNNDEAGIIFDTTTFSRLRLIEADEKQRIRDQMAERGLDNNCLSTISGRMCAVLVRHNESSRNVLVVSWHGKWAGMTEEMRRLAFKYLQEFVCRLRTDVIGDDLVPIIIGGDFNLNLENVGDDFLLPQFCVGTYEQTERRKTRGLEPIDYFVYTCTADTNITINDVYPLELKQNSPNSSFNTDETADLTQWQLFGLDHDPIRGTLIFN